MNLTDARLYLKRVPWEDLVKEGYDPKIVMMEAQRQGIWRLAASARNRISNKAGATRRALLKTQGSK